MADEDRILHALAEPRRRALYERLVRAPQTVAQLTRGAGISQPAVSQHLKVLREAGLVVARPVGAATIHEIDPAGLGPLRAWLDRFWDDQLQRFKQAAEKPAPEKD